MSKAMLEFGLPALLLVVFFLIMGFSSGKNGAENKKTKSLAVVKHRNAWPVVGATVNGMAAGVGVTIYLKVMNLLPSDAEAILVGSMCGVLGCMISIGCARILENCADSRIFGTALLFGYLVTTSFGLGWLGTVKHYEFTDRVIMSVGACLLLVGVSGYTFWPQSIPKGGPKAMVLREPAILPLMNSPRLLSAPFGTVGGIFVTAKLHTMCMEAQGTYWGFGTAVLCGLITSLIYALATDAIIEKRSSQLAIGAGTFISVVLGVYIKWYIGIAIGSVVGCLLGAVREHYTMMAVMAETVLMVPGDAKPYKPTSRSDGTSNFPGQASKVPASREETLANLPTLVTATPRSGSSEGKTFANALDEDMQALGIEQSQNLMLGASSGRGTKRFGLASTGSPSPSNTAFTNASPVAVDNRSPSDIAMQQGWIGQDGAVSQSNWTQATPGSSRSKGSGSARRSAGALGGSGTAQGGLPVSQNSPGSGRREPRQIASVVRTPAAQAASNGAS